MALGMLQNVFAGSSFGGGVPNGGLQGRGLGFSNQRSNQNASSSRGHAVAMPRPHSSRSNATLQSASAFLDTDYRSAAGNKGQRGGFAAPDFATFLPEQLPQQQLSKLPQALYRLLDPQASVDLPSASAANFRQLDNRELDKLFAALGRNKATWRRALVLHEWLLSMGHIPDDRLCTTLIRVCSQHGQAMTALSLYDWMRSTQREGGAALVPTVYTYTAAMRAALTGNMIERAVKVWDDAVKDGCQPDCRMATTLIEVCTRKGDTARALETYKLMQDAAPGSNMAPSIHAYTAAMRAAAEGGAWQQALDIWSDMEQCKCKPTGHAYAAVISACAVGGAWQRAVQLFDQMLQYQIKPDVVSCTALITALGADGQWQRGSQVVDWMLRSGVKPNVRTYTALITAMGNAQQWDLALDLIKQMKTPQATGGVEPNAYTYSALLKTMGEQGHWQLAEHLFQQLEGESLAPAPQTPPQTPTPTSLNPYSVDWTSPQRQVPDGSGWDNQAASMTAAAMTSSAALNIHTGPSTAEVDDRRLSSGSYGDMPTHLAEQVLDSPTCAASCTLPDEIPGQVNFSPPRSFSFFSASRPASPAPSDQSRSHSLHQSPQQSLHQSPRRVSWTTDNAATSGLQFQRVEVPQPSSSGHSPSSSQSSLSHVNLPAVPACLSPSRGQGGVQEGSAISTGDHAKWGLDMRVTDLKPKVLQAPGRSGKGPINEVVCGAMMLAYERAGKWEQAVKLLEKARAMGIAPNTIMYNTAMSSLGKAGQWEAAEQLFREVPEPDAVTFETLIAAYGMAGQASQAEIAFQYMQKAHHTPRDYAYCGLIAAHSLSGNWRAALNVKNRLRQAGSVLTVHVYNALIAACERSQQFDLGVQLSKDMRRDSVQPDQVTSQLLQTLSSKGVALIEKQQVAAAALSAAVAAAGTLVMRAGMW